MNRRNDDRDLWLGILGILNILLIFAVAMLLFTPPKETLFRLRLELPERYIK